MKYEHSSCYVYPQVARTGQEENVYWHPKLVMDLEVLQRKELEMEEL